MSQRTGCADSPAASASLGARRKTFLKEKTKLLRLRDILLTTTGKRERNKGIPQGKPHGDIFRAGELGGFDYTGSEKRPQSKPRRCENKRRLRRRAEAD